MFKNMKLGTKIASGFGIILVIAIFLGGLAVVSMTGVKGGANELAKERVPEVAVANNVERWSLKTMYDMRGYTLSDDKTYWDKTLKNLEEVKKYLKEAEELSRKSSNLKDLAENAKIASQKVDEYEKLAKQSNEVMDKIDVNKTNLNDAASRYINEAEAYIVGQTEAMKKDIEGKASAGKLKERVLKITVANNIIDMGNAIRIANFKSQSLRDFSYIKEAMKKFDDIEKLLNSLKPLTTQEVNLKQIEAVRDAGNKYKNELNLLIANFDILTELNKERGMAADEVLKAAEDTAIGGMDKTSSIANVSSLSLGAATVTMIIGLITALVLGIIIAVVIITSITKPVNRIASRISEGADQVSSASQQLSVSSQRLAEGASEQASALEETSATLSQSASMIQQNTQNTKQAAMLSEKAKEAAEKGNKDMVDMNNSMESLKKSSDDIARIIKVIDDIAFQTNILALNAAVEAARAGDAGMGFAVVAEEVRNLAQRSAQAAKETSAIIEKNLELSVQGVGVSKKVAESLDEIMTQARKVNEIMDEIAAASQEQSQGIEQINKAVNQMEQVTQSSASSAEESAAASEELSAQAEGMKEVINELIALVYGSEQKGMAVVRHEDNYPKYTSKSNTRTSAQTMNKIREVKTRVVKPSDIIPLEDDMKGF